MPLFFSDALDDPVTYDGTTSFAGGQVSNVRANLLQDTESAFLLNCDITKSGELATRRGSAQLGTTTAGTGSSVGANDYVQGLTYFQTPAASYPVAVTGGTAYKFDGTNWVVLGTTAHTFADNRVHAFLVQGTNKLYTADGVGNLYDWDGTTWNALGGAANTNPPNSPYCLVWHSSRLIAVGSADPDAIYFSQFLDGTLWDRAKWSLKVGNTGGGTTGGFPSGTNEPITGLFSWLDFNLIVFKQGSIWVVNCNPAFQLNDANNTIAGFEVLPVHKFIGCIAPLSAAQVGSDVWFLATDGVRSMKRTLAASSQSEISESLSLPVDDIIKRITPNAATKPVGFFWNNRYMLALPLDGALENNYLLVFNFLTQTWSGLWQGWNVTNFATLKVAGAAPRLMFGQSGTSPAGSTVGGMVFEWLDYIPVDEEVDSTYMDQNDEIQTEVLSRAITSRDPGSPKTALNVELEFHNSLATVDVAAVLDSLEHWAAIAINTGPGVLTLPFYLPATLPEGIVYRPSFDLQRFGPYRELQIEVFSASKKMVLHAIIVGAFIETVHLQAV